MKIVILEGNAVNPGDLSWEVLNQFGQVTVYARTAPSEAAARIGDAEIVLINKTPITAELLDACPSIRLICVQATGYNVVDCQAAKERNVLVCITSAAALGSVPKLIPPPCTLGQLTFTSSQPTCSSLSSFSQV